MVRLKKESIPIIDKGYDAKILITRKCNLNCPFCRIKRKKRLRGEMSLEQWKKGIKNLENIGITSI